MNIIIIEDERLVADDLQSSIQQLVDTPTVIKKLRSVKESIAYFQGKPEVDLIFSDIQLGDGLSFEIFMNVDLSTPIIFCTAYDQYALDAFNANGIDYILKPFTSETLDRALKKYAQLKRQFSGGNNYERLMEVLTLRNKQPASSSILVYYQDKIMPIKLSEIALFYLQNETVRIVTFDGKNYYPNKSLEELEKITGSTFFRANRQFLVSRKVIKDVSSFFSRKLSLNLTIVFEEKITVSKMKSPLFLEWLSKAD